MKRSATLFLVVLLGAESLQAQGRVAKGLIAFYDFSNAKEQVIRDQSNHGRPLDLVIEKPAALKRQTGSLTLAGNATRIRSSTSATKLTTAIMQSGELTLETWIQPANASQKGPTRILTLSKDAVNRNFTLGQDANRYDVRLRSTKTSANGLPSVSTSKQTAKPKLVHLVFTRSRDGQTTIYLDGKQAAKGKAEGDFSNWSSEYRLAIGDELTGDRAWDGTIHLVAIYKRALSGKEIAQNFLAGKDGNDDEAVERIAAQKRKESFIHNIAPLIADRCLECHDSATRDGDLDLSRKASALAGGESGKGIVPGDAAASLVWKSVIHDEMPHDREPLTDREKSSLKKWIDDGAIWPLDFIDPAIYTHGSRSKGIWVQRLTVPEYIATVQTAIGVDLSKEAREQLPPDSRADGFSNTAYNLTVDLKHIDAYARLANIAVRRMDVLPFAARFKKGRSLTDKHMRELITKMGKWVLRGPLDESEIAIYRGISTTVASTGGDYQEAVQYVLEAMLQSPRFIYRMESHIGDGSRWPTDRYELANRLSYILWGAPPNEKILDAAESGKLSEVGFTRNLVGEMLQDPRAISRSQEFIRQWMNLDRLENLRPDPKHFPDWDPSLAEAMERETLEFFREIVWEQKRSLSDILNAQVTFLNAELADHYGIPAQGDKWIKYDLSQVPSRGGLLTQGSALTIGGDEASMVTRGLMVMHELLRGVVKDPPPCVDTTPVPTKPGLTQRMIAEQRIQNEACGGCHGKFEPLAFGLEKYDGLGTFHDRDSFGNPLRDDGEVLVPGTNSPKAYGGATELMDLLASSNRVQTSLTWKVVQFSLGRPLVADDAPIIQSIHQNASKNGGTYQAIMTELVMSDLVQLKKTETQAD